MAAVDTAMTSEPNTPRYYGTPKQQLPRGSSARPGGLPSESNAPQSDDEGFADDQVPINPNRPRGDRAIPRVEDRVGLVVQENFERFLETYGSHILGSN